MTQKEKEVHFNRINQLTSLSNYSCALKQIVKVLEAGVDVYTDTFLNDAFTHILKMISFTNFYMGHRIMPNISELSPYMLMLDRLIDKPTITH
jgi:hypothetical protein